MNRVIRPPPCRYRTDPGLGPASPGLLLKEEMRNNKWMFTVIYYYPVRDLLLSRTLYMMLTTV